MFDEANELYFNLYIITEKDNNYVISLSKLIVNRFIQNYIVEKNCYYYGSHCIYVINYSAMSNNNHLLNLRNYLEIF